MSNNEHTIKISIEYYILFGKFITDWSSIAAVQLSEGTVLHYVALLICWEFSWVLNVSYLNEYSVGFGEKNNSFSDSLQVFGVREALI